MLKLLFIEDDPKAIAHVLRLIKRGKKNVCYEVSKFGAAEERIAAFHPDIVILDLLVGSASPAEMEPEGLKTRKFIWDQCFCPIIVYSARPEIHDDEHDPHPFVKSIRKGTGSPQKVLDAVCEFLPHAAALKEAESDMRHFYFRAMQEVAPYAFEVFTDTDKRVGMIKRAGRRRLAALMDEFSSDGSALASWEQYLYPPISHNILLGDILKESGGNKANPTSFRVVLTPSCDMVGTKGQAPKVRQHSGGQVLLNKRRIRSNGPKWH